MNIFFFIITEFAVATSSSEILFYDNNWTPVKTLQAPSFGQILALNFDYEDDIVMISNAEEKLVYFHLNDSPSDNLTVAEIDFNSHQSAAVLGIAYDPLHKNFYWTDAFAQSIFKAHLNDDDQKSDEQFSDIEMLIKFDNKIPHGIAVDICGRFVNYLFFIQS